MHIHSLTIGVKLNKTMFRLASVGGTLTDALLTLKDEDKHFDEDYFTQYSASNNLKDLNFSLSNENSTIKFTVAADNILLQKTSPNDHSSVQTEKALEEFQQLWKTADSILHFPAIRRIGLVAEYKIDTIDKNSTSTFLIESLLSVEAPQYSGRFLLSYEDRKPTVTGGFPDLETDDFWNTIYTITTNKAEDIHSDQRISATIDVQKYYNPAKTNPLGELRNVKKQFVREKTAFKKELSKMGLG